MVILGATPAFSTTEPMMDFLKILRDEGTLTQNEYGLLINASKADKEHIEDIKADTNQTIAKQIKETKNDAGWASKVKVKGDVRLRY